MRRSYRSARRRRWGRYDPSPVLLVTEDDRTLYLGSAARMAWRYRSELAPFTTALLLALCGAWTHSRHPGAAVPLAVLTVAVTAVLAVPPARWSYTAQRSGPADPADRADRPGPVARLVRAGRWVAGWVPEVLSRWPVYTRPAERLYAAAVLALGGAWSAAAARSGPGAPPLPTVLLLGCLAGGVPWWTHRRRRARVRVARIVEAWPTFSAEVNLPGSRLVSATVDRWGWTGRLALRRGQTAEEVIAAAGKIESALHSRRGGVRVEPDPARADRAIVRVVDDDPLADAVPWPGLPATGTTEAGRAPSILDPVELGVFEDGSPVLLRLAYRGALIGGLTGSGKSGVLNVVIAYLVACRDVAVWGIDLKGGIELAPWASCLGRLATTAEEAAAVLADTRAVHDHRTRSLRGRKTWRPGRAGSDNADGPALILVIDEFAELPEHLKAEVESLSRLGRAMMVNLIIATQRPTQEALGGGALRSQLDIRICLRMREKRDIELILDRGAWAAGWRADLLDEPGKFLISDPEHATPHPARGYRITEPQVDDTAAGHAANQPAIAIPGNPQPPSPQPTIRPTANSGPDPEQLLWETLLKATEAGVTVAEFMDTTGKGRTWVYSRLRDHAAAGRAAATGTRRGAWRTTTNPTSEPTTEHEPEPGAGHEA